MAAPRATPQYTFFKGLPAILPSIPPAVCHPQDPAPAPPPLRTSLQDTFFKRLPAILPSIPPAVAIRKILPLLSSALEFGGAPAHAVGSLMVIGKQLEGDEFTKRVVPTLSKLFASPGNGDECHVVHPQVGIRKARSAPTLSKLFAPPLLCW